MTFTPFLILENQGGGQVPLSEVTTFGRAEGNAVVLKDIGVSTQHAVIRKDGVFWVVEDLGSTNGTWLNHQRVEGPTVIKEGDQLQMGSQRLRVSGFRGNLEPTLPTSVPNACTRCQKTLPPQEVFCPACGLPVAGPPPLRSTDRSGWPTPTAPFKVPYPNGVPSSDAKRNTMLLGFAIVGGLALILAVLLGWMLRDKVSKKEGPRTSHSTLFSNLKSPSRMVKGWGGQPGM